MRIIDLSRELYHRTPSYPGQPPIIHGVWKTHEEAFADSGNVHGNSVMYFSMPDHGGTHIDAPRHFGRSGIPINEYPLENCIVPGICIDLRHIAARAEIAPADLEAAVKRQVLRSRSAAPSCSARVIMRAPFPTRLCHRQPRCQCRSNRMAGGARALCISASTPCARVRRVTSTRSCTRRA